MSTFFIILMVLFFIIIPARNNKRKRRRLEEMAQEDYMEKDLQPDVTLQYDPVLGTFLKVGVEKNREDASPKADERKSPLKKRSKVMPKSQELTVKMPENQDIKPQTKTDFDLDVTAENLVIYSAIMEPKYKEY